MDKQPPSRAPLLIATVVLLLPVLYVGSYLALVAPEGIERERVVREPVAYPLGSLQEYSERYLGHYRVAGDWPGVLYYPLEIMDRRLRPWAEKFDGPKDGEIRIVRDPNWGK